MRFGKGNNIECPRFKRLHCFYSFKSGKTVNGDWYKNNCLKEIYKNSRKHLKSGLWRLRLYHDSGLADSSNITVHL